MAKVRKLPIEKRKFPDMYHEIIKLSNKFKDPKMTHDKRLGRIIEDIFFKMYQMAEYSLEAYNSKNLEDKLKYAYKVELTRKEVEIGLQYMQSIKDISMGFLYELEIHLINIMEQNTRWIKSIKEKINQGSEKK